jgi:hypothetical protein
LLAKLLIDLGAGTHLLVRMRARPPEPSRTRCRSGRHMLQQNSCSLPNAEGMGRLLKVFVIRLHQSHPYRQKSTKQKEQKLIVSHRRTKVDLRPIAAREKCSRLQALQTRLHRLTLRERQVLEHGSAFYRRS